MPNEVLDDPELSALFVETTLEALDELTQGLTAVQISQSRENIADSQEKRAQAELNRAKTLTEINKNQFDPITSLIKEQVKLQISRDRIDALREKQNAG